MSLEAHFRRSSVLRRIISLALSFTFLVSNLTFAQEPSDNRQTLAARSLSQLISEHGDGLALLSADPERGGVARNQRPPKDKLEEMFRSRAYSRAEGWVKVWAAFEAAKMARKIDSLGDTVSLDDAEEKIISDIKAAARNKTNNIPEYRRDALIDAIRVAFANLRVDYPATIEMSKTKNDEGAPYGKTRKTPRREAQRSRLEAKEEVLKYSTDRFMQYINDAFTISTEDMGRIVDDFQSEMDAGLAGREGSLQMLETFVAPPTGNEKGEFFAIDVGGTNVRVTKALLRGNGKVVKLGTKEEKIPEALKTGSAEELFDFIAQTVASFIKKEKLEKKEKLTFGFTWSFPIKQTGVASGIHDKWTKGWNVKGVVGQDVVKLLNEALGRKEVTNVHIAALCNDTVGTLAAGKYANPKCDEGVILGTGTNAAIPISIKDILKSKESQFAADTMMVNMEWGNFNLLPITRWDEQLDMASENKGEQLLEKMVSGMYLGEITRLILIDLINKKMLFKGQNIGLLSNAGSLTGQDVSDIEGDNSRNLDGINAILIKLGVTASTIEEREYVKYITGLVSTRASRIVAAAMVAVIKKIDPKLSRNHLIAIDGTVYEDHISFKYKIDAALKRLLENKSSNISLALTKDGSSLGAAIIAAAATYRSEGIEIKRRAPSVKPAEKSAEWLTPEEATALLDKLTTISKIGSADDGDINGLKGYSRLAIEGKYSEEKVLEDLGKELAVMLDILNRTRPKDELIKLTADGVTERQLDILRGASEFILQLLPDEYISQLSGGKEGADNLTLLANIKEVFAAHPVISKQLVDYFETKFNPNEGVQLRSDAAFELRRNIEKQLKKIVGKDYYILRQCLTMIMATIKTDYYVEKRTELFFRMDPKVIQSYDRKGVFGHTPPFGIIWVHVPYGCFGGHSRYANIARGGLRVISSDRTDMLSDIMKECRALSSTQEDKHLFICEGGSKGTCQHSELLNFVASVIGYVDGLVRCKMVGEENIVSASVSPILDPLYLGPDESTSELTTLITVLGYMRGLPDWQTLITGKLEALGGISHKDNNLLNPREAGNRVTSQGVLQHAVHMVEYQRAIGRIKSRKGEPLAISISGGLDGDVASGEVERSIHHWGDQAKLRSFMDLSASVFDPEGLDHEELFRLYHESGKGATARNFRKDKLHKGGFVIEAKEGESEDSYVILDYDTLQHMNTRPLDPDFVENSGAAKKYRQTAKIGADKPLVEVLEKDDKEHPKKVKIHSIYLRQILFFLVKTDIFLSGGGHSYSINDNNWEFFFDWDGNPTAGTIVHGANIFMTKDAAIMLEKNGVIIEPDARANSVGVEVSSRAEVDFNTLFTSNERRAGPRLLGRYFKEVLGKCREAAVKTFYMLRIEAENNPGKSVVIEVSPRMSEEIAPLKQLIEGSHLVSDRREGYSDTVLSYLKEYFPEVSDIDRRYGSTLGRVFDRMPFDRIKAIAAKMIARDMVLNLGLGAVKKIKNNTGAAEIEIVEEYMRVAKQMNINAEMKRIMSDGSIDPLEKIKRLKTIRGKSKTAITNSIKYRRMLPIKALKALESNISGGLYGAGAADTLRQVQTILKIAQKVGNGTPLSRLIDIRGLKKSFPEGVEGVKEYLLVRALVNILAFTTDILSEGSGNEKLVDLRDTIINILDPGFADDIKGWFNPAFIGKHKVISVPKETMSQEGRVGLTPIGVVILRAMGVNKIIVERGAGLASGYSDEEYENAGAALMDTPEEAWSGDCVIKVKEPLPPEYKFLGPGKTVVTYFHLASKKNKELVEALMASGLGRAVDLEKPKLKYVLAVACGANKAKDVYPELKYSENIRGGKLASLEVALAHRVTKGLNHTIFIDRLNEIIDEADKTDAGRSEALKAKVMAYGELLAHYKAKLGLSSPVTQRYVKELIGISRATEKSVAERAMALGELLSNGVYEKESAKEQDAIRELFRLIERETKYSTVRARAYSALLACGYKVEEQMQALNRIIEEAPANEPLVKAIAYGASLKYGRSGKWYQVVFDRHKVFPLSLLTNGSMPAAEEKAILYEALLETGIYHDEAALFEKIYEMILKSPKAGWMARTRLLGALLRRFGKTPKPVEGDDRSKEAPNMGTRAMPHLDMDNVQKPLIEAGRVVEASFDEDDNLNTKKIGLDGAGEDVVLSRRLSNKLTGVKEALDTIYASLELGEDKLAYSAISLYESGIKLTIGDIYQKFYRSAAKADYSAARPEEERKFVFNRFRELIGRARRAKINLVLGSAYVNEEELVTAHARRAVRDASAPLGYAAWIGEKLLKKLNMDDFLYLVLQEALHFGNYKERGTINTFIDYDRVIEHDEEFQDRLDKLAGKAARRYRLPRPAVFFGRNFTPEEEDLLVRISLYGITRERAVDVSDAFFIKDRYSSSAIYAINEFLQTRELTPGTRQNLITARNIIARQQSLIAILKNDYVLPEKRLGALSELAVYGSDAALHAIETNLSQNEGRLSTGEIINLNIAKTLIEARAGLRRDAGATLAVSAPGGHGAGVRYIAVHGITDTEALQIASGQILFYGISDPPIALINNFLRDPKLTPEERENLIAARRIITRQQKLLRTIAGKGIAAGRGLAAFSELLSYGSDAAVRAIASFHERNITGLADSKKANLDESKEVMGWSQYKKALLACADPRIGYMNRKAIAEEVWRLAEGSDVPQERLQEFVMAYSEKARKDHFSLAKEDKETITMGIIAIAGGVMALAAGYFVPCEIIAQYFLAIAGYFSIIFGIAPLLGTISELHNERAGKEQSLHVEIMSEDSSLKRDFRSFVERLKDEAPNMRSAAPLPLVAIRKLGPTTRRERVKNQWDEDTGEERVVIVPGYYTILAQRQRDGEHVVIVNVPAEIADKIGNETIEIFARPHGWHHGEEKPLYTYMSTASEQRDDRPQTISLHNPPLDQLKEGDIVEAVVVSCDRGRVFVDPMLEGIGNVAINMRELSSHWVGSAQDEVLPGQKVKCVITSLDRDAKHIQLSRRQWLYRAFKEMWNSRVINPENTYDAVITRSYEKEGKVKGWFAEIDFGEDRDEEIGDTRIILDGLIQENLLPHGRAIYEGQRIRVKVRTYRQNDAGKILLKFARVEIVGEPIAADEKSPREVAYAVDLHGKMVTIVDDGAGYEGGRIHDALDDLIAHYYGEELPAEYKARVIGYDSDEAKIIRSLLDANGLTDLLKIFNDLTSGKHAAGVTENSLQPHHFQISVLPTQDNEEGGSLYHVVSPRPEYDGADIYGHASDQGIFSAEMGDPLYNVRVILVELLRFMAVDDEVVREFNDVIGDVVDRSNHDLETVKGFKSEGGLQEKINAQSKRFTIIRGEETFLRPYDLLKNLKAHQARVRLPVTPRPVTLAFKGNVNVVEQLEFSAEGMDKQQQKVFDAFCALEAPRQIDSIKKEGALKMILAALTCADKDTRLKAAELIARLATQSEAMAVFTAYLSKAPPANAFYCAVVMGLIRGFEPEIPVLTLLEDGKLAESARAIKDFIKGKKFTKAQARSLENIWQHVQLAMYGSLKEKISIERQDGAMLKDTKRRTTLDGEELPELTVVEAPPAQALRPPTAPTPTTPRTKARGIVCLTIDREQSGTPKFVGQTKLVFAHREDTAVPVILGNASAEALERGFVFAHDTGEDISIIPCYEALEEGLQALLAAHRQKTPVEATVVRCVSGTLMCEINGFDAFIPQNLARKAGLDTDENILTGSSILCGVEEIDINEVDLAMLQSPIFELLDRYGVSAGRTGRDVGRIVLKPFVPVNKLPRQLRAGDSVEGLVVGYGESKSGQGEKWVDVNFGSFRSRIYMDELAGYSLKSPAKEAPIGRTIKCVVMDTGISSPSGVKVSRRQWIFNAFMKMWQDGQLQPGQTVKGTITTRENGRDAWYWNAVFNFGEYEGVPINIEVFIPLQLLGQSVVKEGDSVSAVLNRCDRGSEGNPLINFSKVEFESPELVEPFKEEERSLSLDEAIEACIAIYKKAFPDKMRLWERIDVKLVRDDGVRIDWSDYYFRDADDVRSKMGELLSWYARDYQFKVEQTSFANPATAEIDMITITLCKPEAGELSRDGRWLTYAVNKQGTRVNIPDEEKLHGALDDALKSDFSTGAAKQIAPDSHEITIVKEWINNILGERSALGRIFLDLVKGEHTAGVTGPSPKGHFQISVVTSDKGCLYETEDGIKILAHASDNGLFITDRGNPVMNAELIFFELLRFMAINARLVDEIAAPLARFAAGQSKNSDPEYLWKWSEFRLSDYFAEQKTAELVKSLKAQAERFALDSTLRPGDLLTNFNMHHERIAPKTVEYAPVMDAKGRTVEVRDEVALRRLQSMARSYVHAGQKARGIKVRRLSKDDAAAKIITAWLKKHDLTALDRVFSRLLDENKAIPILLITNNRVGDRQAPLHRLEINDPPRRGAVNVCGIAADEGIVISDSADDVENAWLIFSGLLRFMGIGQDLADRIAEAFDKFSRSLPTHAVSTKRTYGTLPPRDLEAFKFAINTDLLVDLKSQLAIFEERPRPAGLLTDPAARQITIPPRQIAFAEATGVTEALLQRLERIKYAGTTPYGLGIFDVATVKAMSEAGALGGIVTSPLAFQDAIKGSDSYDEEIRTLAARNLSDREIYDEIVKREVCERADIFKQAGGAISVWVDPALVSNTGAVRQSLFQGPMTYARVGRSNIMVSIPATEEGLAVMASLTGEGVNVNASLIFGREQYRKVVAVYLDGLERCLEEGGDIGRINSTASVYVGSLDAELNKILNVAEKIKGLGGAALARLIYMDYAAIFMKEEPVCRDEGTDELRARFKRLQAKARGAGRSVNVQNIIWADTDVADKNRDPLVLISNLLIEHSMVGFSPRALTELQERIEFPFSKRDPSSHIVTDSHSHEAFGQRAVTSVYDPIAVEEGLRVILRSATGLEIQDLEGLAGLLTERAVRELQDAEAATMKHIAEAAGEIRPKLNKHEPTPVVVDAVVTGDAAAPAGTAPTKPTPETYTARQILDMIVEDDAESAVLAVDESANTAEGHSDLCEEIIRIALEDARITKDSGPARALVAFITGAKEYGLITEDMAAGLTSLVSDKFITTQALAQEKHPDEKELERGKVDYAKLKAELTELSEALEMAKARGAEIDYSAMKETLEKFLAALENAQSKRKMSDKDRLVLVRDNYWAWDGAIRKALDAIGALTNTAASRYLMNPANDHILNMIITRGVIKKADVAHAKAKECIGNFINIIRSIALPEVTRKLSPKKSAAPAITPPGKTLKPILIEELEAGRVSAYGELKVNVEKVSERKYNIRVSIVPDDEKRTSAAEDLRESLRLQVERSLNKLTADIFKETGTSLHSYGMSELRAGLRVYWRGVLDMLSDGDRALAIKVTTALAAGGKKNTHISNFARYGNTVWMGANFAGLANFSHTFLEPLSKVREPGKFEVGSFSMRATREKISEAGIDVAIVDNLFNERLLHDFGEIGNPAATIPERARAEMRCTAAEFAYYIVNTRSSINSIKDASGRTDLMTKYIKDFFDRYNKDVLHKYLHFHSMEHFTWLDSLASMYDDAYSSPLAGFEYFHGFQLPNNIRGAIAHRVGIMYDNWGELPPETLAKAAAPFGAPVSQPAIPYVALKKGLDTLKEKVDAAEKSKAEITELDRKELIGALEDILTKMSYISRHINEKLTSLKNRYGTRDQFIWEIKRIIGEAATKSEEEIFKCHLNNVSADSFNKEVRDKISSGRTRADIISSIEKRIGQNHPGAVAISNILTWLWGIYSEGGEPSAEEVEKIIAENDLTDDETNIIRSLTATSGQPGENVVAPGMVPDDRQYKPILHNVVESKVREHLGTTQITVKKTDGEQYIIYATNQAGTPEAPEANELARQIQEALQELTDDIIYKRYTGIKGTLPPDLFGVLGRELKEHWVAILEKAIADGTTFNIKITDALASFDVPANSARYGNDIYLGTGFANLMSVKRFLALVARSQEGDTVQIIGEEEKRVLKREEIDASKEGLLVIRRLFRERLLHEFFETADTDADLKETRDAERRCRAAEIAHHVLFTDDDDRQGITSLFKAYNPIIKFRSGRYFMEIKRLSDMLYGIGLPLTLNAQAVPPRNMFGFTLPQPVNEGIKSSTNRMYPDGLVMGEETVKPFGVPPEELAVGEETTGPIVEPITEAIETVRAATKAMAADEALQDGIDLNNTAVLVMSKGLSQTLLEKGDVSLQQHYRVMMQEIRERFYGEKIVEVEKNDIAATVSGLIGDGRKVIILDDDTATEHLDPESIRNPKKEGAPKALAGTDYCVVSTGPLDGFDDLTMVPFINLNAMAMMGVGIVYDKSSLFEKAYKTFTGKDAPENYLRKLTERALWIIRELPRIIKFTDALQMQQMAKKLFDSAA